LILIENGWALPLRWLRRPSSCAATVGYPEYARPGELTEQELAEVHEELPGTSLDDKAKVATDEGQLPHADPESAPPELNSTSADEDLFGGMSDLFDDDRSKNPERADRIGRRRLAVVKSGDATSASEAAVQLGLKWLVRHQEIDGSWSFKTSNEASNAIDSRLGATGLALLAFLGAGNTHKAGVYTRTVREGLIYLVRNMKVTSSGGDLRGGAGHHGMYSHGICTAALCEAYILTKDRELAYPAQLAIDFIVNAQHQAGGWRYEPGQAGDLSVTGWQIIALKMGKVAKLKVPTRCIGKAVAFLNAVQSDGGAQYGYDKPGAGPAMTAIGLLSRMYLGWTDRQTALGKGVEIVGSLGPQPNNIYFNYYATQVLHHWGGEEWKKWNAAMREQLVQTQEKEGDAAGSWSPVDDQWGKSYGGRLYTTCLSIITLEVYYRHLSRQLRP
jgi:hypothetical protein